MLSLGLFGYAVPRGASVGALVALCGMAAPAADAAYVTYSSRATFQGTLGASITDNYSAPGYLAGDIINGANFDTHSDAHMSAVLGQTVYKTTGWPNASAILQTGNPAYYSNRYCAGCNGSFLLSFAATSVGDENGVYGVGFDFNNTQSYASLHAFVTFGDLSTLDIELPVVVLPLAFFGITSELGILSIHFGGANGARTEDGNFALDNLTIGAAKATTISEPAPALLFALGIAGLGWAARRLPATTSAEG